MKNKDGISQGAEGSEPDYSEAHSLSESIRAYGVGVEEKKEPETTWIEILKGMTEGSQPAQIHRYRNELKSLLTYLRGVSEREEPTQEEQKQNYEDIIELSKGFTAEAILKNYTITRRA